ncbi:glutamate--tRNA ligase [Patescibacteria group bacterium]
MKKQEVRVRFAPSPTGFLHIGGLRTLLYDYLFAKKNKGTLVLRIEDTDQSRYVEGSIESLLETIKWSGLDYDEGIEKEGPYGPYQQSKRLELYKEKVGELVKAGKAYYAFDTAEELDAMRKEQQKAHVAPMYDRDSMKNSLTIGEEETQKKIDADDEFVVRLKVPEGKDIKFHDIVRGDVSINTNTVDDQVLLKSDGFPTYHLAVVVDDHEMKISHVIRGEEWLPSTPKHVLLYEAFGWDLPEYAHVPLMLNTDKSKLSKRQGDVSVDHYRDVGYLPQAMLNFVVLLGWNPKTEQEIFTMEEMVDAFDLKKINKAGAVVDFERLNWFNSHFIKELDDNSYLEATKKVLGNTDSLSDKQLEKALLIQKDRINKFDEVSHFMEMFVKYDDSYKSEDLIWKKSDKEETSDALKKAYTFIEDLPDEEFELEKLEEKLRELVTEMGIPAGNFFWPLRYALSGKPESPGVFEMLWALEKKESLKRIQVAQAKF